MKARYDFCIPGSNGRDMAADLFLPDTTEPVPLLVYAHGFNGFKDWGGADLIAAQAVSAGFGWLRFNFSHNGTTPERPLDFVDLEAFAANTYSKELADLDAVFDYVGSPGSAWEPRFDRSRIGLIGHSKGGADAILFAAGDSRVSALVTWAAVSAARTPWDSWDDTRMQRWQASGREHIPNSRTGQQMPLDYTLVSDYEAHRDRLDVLAAAARINVPWLICHGTADTSVALSHAERLHAANPRSETFITDTDHVFGRKHPWTADQLPEATLAILGRTFMFFSDAL